MDAKSWKPSEIIELYSQGYTDIEVVKAMGITKKQFDRMVQTNPVFREIVERGNDYSLAWNIEQSRVNLHNREFNSQLFNSRMQALHNWATKVESKNANINADMSADEVIARLATMLPNVAHLLPKEQAEKIKMLTKEVSSDDRDE